MYITKEHYIEAILQKKEVAVN